MSQHYVVPAIYQDMSDQSQGYFAFRFTCQQCYWSIDSRPIRSSVSTATNIMDIGVGLLGGFWGRAAEAGEKIYGTRWHAEQADALQKSWAQVQHEFHLCPMCHRTVCIRCFNVKLGLCTQCAPDLRADGASFQHGLNLDAQRAQIQQGYMAPQFNVNAVPSAVTPDLVMPPRASSSQLPPPNIPVIQPPLSAEVQPSQPPAALSPAASRGLSTPGYAKEVTCPKCRRMGPGGKFCQDCGTKLPMSELFCPQCASPIENSPRFCPECGTKLQAAT